MLEKINAESMLITLSCFGIALHPLQKRWVMWRWRSTWLGRRRRRSPACQRDSSGHLSTTRALSSLQYMSRFQMTSGEKVAAWIIICKSRCNLPETQVLLQRPPNPAPRCALFGEAAPKSAHLHHWWSGGKGGRIQVGWLKGIWIFAQHFSGSSLKARGDNPKGGKIKKRTSLSTVAKGARWLTPTRTQVWNFQDANFCWSVTTAGGKTSSTAPLHSDLLLHDLASWRKAPVTEQQR